MPEAVMRIEWSDHFQNVFVLMSIIKCYDTSQVQVYLILIVLLIICCYDQGLVLFVYVNCRIGACPQML